jgi:hypothetical protein
LKQTPRHSMITVHLCTLCCLVRCMVALQLIVCDTQPHGTHLSQDQASSVCYDFTFKSQLSVGCVRVDFPTHCTQYQAVCAALRPLLAHEHRQ